MYRFVQAKAYEIEETCNEAEKKGWKVVSMSCNPSRSFANVNQYYGLLFHKDGK